GRRVLVLGLGIDVTAALPHVLAARPADVVVVADDPERARARLAERGQGLPVVHAAGDAGRADVAVRSPGFPLYREDVQVRVRRGLVTVTPLGLWLGERGNRPSVGVTGTKGKSTTATLVAAALGQLGRDAEVL